MRYVDVVGVFGKGGYKVLRKLAGLRAPEPARKVGMESLMEEFHGVATMIGRMPTLAHVSRVTGRSARVLRRLGRHREIKARYEEWLAARGAAAALPVRKGGGARQAWRVNRGFGRPIDV